MKNKKHTPLLAALATLVVLLAGVVLIWLAKVRPDVGKGRSEIVTDFLRAELLQDGQTATQVFTYDKDILTIGLEFYLPGDQPCGALDVVLYDADTGEELSRSVGTMDYIVPDQYTTLGMDPAVTGQEGRRYKLAVTPHYATDAILAIGHSDGVALWKEQMAVDDRAIDGTMAMQITYQRIGGYLTRFFLLVGGLAAVLAALAVWGIARARRTPADTVRAEFRALYKKMCRCGLSEGVSSDQEEFKQFLWEHTKTAAPQDVETLLALVQTAQFAPGPVSAQTAQQVRGLCRILRKNLHR